MNTSQLRYIVEVEKTGSISRAAANLSMNQPHLSKSVREIEDSLGVTLFYRSSRGVIPTEQGTKVLEYAKKILAQMDEIEKICHSGGVSKVLFSLAAPVSEYVPRALGEFVKTLDAAVPMSIDYIEAGGVDAAAMVASGKDNLGIIRFHEGQEKYFKNLALSYSLTMEELWEFKPIVLVSKRSPYASQGSLTPSMLSDCIEIVDGGLNTAARSGGEEWEISNSKITVYQRSGRFELLCANANTYMWAAPMSEEITDRFGILQKKPAFPAVAYRDALICRSDYSFTDADKSFLEILKGDICELKKNGG